MPVPSSPLPVVPPGDLPDGPPIDLGDIDPAFLAARGIVPLGVADGRLVVAMADPDDADTIAALAFGARRPVVARAPVAVVAVVTGPETAEPSRPARSLVDGIAAAIGGDRFDDWVAADRAARAAAGAGDAAAGAAAGERAAAMRFDLEWGIAVRRAIGLPMLAGIVAAVTVGRWAILLLAALWPLRAALRMRAAAAADGDAAAVARERALMGAARERALLGMAHGGARAATLALLGLAVLLVVRLG